MNDNWEVIYPANAFNDYGYNLEEAAYHVIDNVEGNKIYLEFFNKKQLRDCNNYYIRNGLDIYKKYYKFIENAH
jgi:hypothetical protein